MSPLPVLAAVLLAAPAGADLVQQARQSLTEAEQSVKQSAEACRGGEWEKCNALLTDVQKGVEGAKESLDKTGINPARSPRHFKDAEIRIRKILRFLRDLGGYVHPDDRKHYETVVKRVSDIDDQILESILTRKKK
jgi:hypothetical protein